MPQRLSREYVCIYNQLHSCVAKKPPANTLSSLSLGQFSPHFIICLVSFVSGSMQRKPGWKWMKGIKAIISMNACVCCFLLRFMECSFCLLFSIATVCCHSYWTADLDLIYSWCELVGYTVWCARVDRRFCSLLPLGRKLHVLESSGSTAIIQCFSHEPQTNKQCSHCC